MRYRASTVSSTITPRNRPERSSGSDPASLVSSLRPIRLARRGDVASSQARLTSGALMDHGGIIVSKTQSQSSGEDVLARLPIPRKLRAIMLAQAIPPARRWVIAALTRPFSLREALIACPLLLAVGVVYCQIYCLLALQQMHGASMPIL